MPRGYKSVDGIKGKIVKRVLVGFYESPRGAVPHKSNLVFLAGLITICREHNVRRS